MKNMLQGRSRRWGFDGWALRVRDAATPLAWSVCTTRRECRELRDERQDLADNFEVVKVRIRLEVVDR